MLASGPYGLIYASSVLFYLDIPVSRRSHVLGVQLSDKASVYLVDLLLLLSSGKRSILPAICGILAGSLYRLNLFRISQAKIPECVTSLFSWISWPTQSIPVAPVSNVGTVPSYTRRQLEGTHPYLVPSAIEPPADSIATMVSMGFDRNIARLALMCARNDINAATNILLEAQSH